jgi:hypothetical protein
VHYYRGLALSTLGRKREAMVEFQRFVSGQRQRPMVRWIKRAEAHLFDLVASLDHPSTAPGGRSPYRVAAMATLRASGALPAPLIDAAWRSRPGMVEPCIEDPPPGVRATAGAAFRISIDVAIDGKGHVTAVKVEGAPSEWRSLAPCLQTRITAGLRSVKPEGARPTSARIELVLAQRP